MGFGVGAAGDRGAGAADRDPAGRREDVGDETVGGGQFGGVSGSVARTGPRPRLLLITGSLQAGGAERQLSEMASYWSAGGAHVTLVTWGAMTVETLRAAAELAALGVGAEVLDLATLSPIDSEAILESVAKTGRLVIVHEAARNVGVGAEIAAIVAEHGLYDLAAPIQRVAGFDTVMPLFRLEHDYIPGVARIVDAVRLALAG